MKNLRIHCLVLSGSQITDEKYNVLSSKRIKFYNNNIERRKKSKNCELRLSERILLRNWFMR